MILTEKKTKQKKSTERNLPHLLRMCGNAAECFRKPNKTYGPLTGSIKHVMDVSRPFTGPITSCGRQSSQQAGDVSRPFTGPVTSCGR